MEDKIELLYEKIKAQYRDYNKLLGLLDEDSQLVREKMHELIGMESAFQIVSGQTSAEYSIKKFRKCTI